MTEQHSDSRTRTTLVFRSLDEHVIAGRADEPAISDDQGDVTYAQLLHDSASLGSALREIGVGRGTHVQVDLPVARDRVVALLACTRLGAEPTSATADFVLTDDPAVLRTPDTEVGWDVLRRAGRIDPAPAPADDPAGYEDRVRAEHADVFDVLTEGGTLT